MRAFFALLFLLFPSLAFAACEGRDLREFLTPEEATVLRAKADATPYGQGNHWIATKDDQTIHLIGTMHYNDQRLDVIRDRLRPVIMNADLLITEISWTDARSTYDRSFETLPRSMSLRELLGIENWRTVAKAAKAINISEEDASRMHPWALALELDIPTCLQTVKDHWQGLDYRMKVVAIASGIQTESLETFGERAAILNELPMEVQIAVLMMAASPDIRKQDFLTTLIDGYFREDISFASGLAQKIWLDGLPDTDRDLWQHHFERFNALLLDARNQFWMPRILNRPERNIIVAFGALHLAGDNGVLNLLQQHGFTLRRAAF